MRLLRLAQGVPALQAVHEPTPVDFRGDPGLLEQIALATWAPLQPHHHLLAPSPFRSEVTRGTALRAPLPEGILRRQVFQTGQRSRQETINGVTAARP